MDFSHEKVSASSRPSYKANLHCHTTVSDGRFTPEEIKAAYKAKGYSVIAFTDHEVLIPHRSSLGIFNSGSLTSGYLEYDPVIYDSVLRRGEKIYCISADDNHGTAEQFGGWVMIRADKLEYRTITKALEDGSFYASTGPEIEDLWFEAGEIHVRCSPAVKVAAYYGSRKVKQEKADSELLTEAFFPVEDDDIFVRLTVYGADGSHADTNAYWVEDLNA